MIRFPNVASRKNIIKHFITDKDLNVKRKIFARLDISDFSDMYVFCCNVEHQDKEINVHLSDVGDIEDQSYKVRRFWEYDLPTQKGYCGGLVSMIDPSMPRKIIGMHIAGSGGNIGYASVITQDLINRGLKQFDDVITAQMNIDSKVLSKPFVEGNFLAGFQAKHYVNQPTKTKIVKTRLHSMWGPAKMAPAILKTFQNSDGEIVDPRKKAIALYGGNITEYDQGLVDACSQHFSHSFFRHTANEPRQIFTWQQAVTGIPGLQYCDSINRGTSPGYPFAQKYPEGKRSFFGKEADYDLDTELCQKELVPRIEEIIDKASKGERC